MTGYGVTNDWISEYEKFLDRKLKRFTLKVNLCIILYTPPCTYSTRDFPYQEVAQLLMVMHWPLNQTLENFEKMIF